MKTIGLYQSTRKVWDLATGRVVGWFNDVEFEPIRAEEWDGVNGFRHERPGCPEPTAWVAIGPRSGVKVVEGYGYRIVTLEIPGRAFKGLTGEALLSLASLGAEGLAIVARPAEPASVAAPSSSVPTLSGVLIR